MLDGVVIDDTEVFDHRLTIVLVTIWTIRLIY